MGDHFQEVKLPQQRNYNSLPFPSVLSPKSTVVPCSVSHLTETIRTQKPFLESLLHKSGAVLLRGYDIKTAKDFNDVIEAFGYEELSYMGGIALRTKVLGRVFTANESPPDQQINFHHEMSQVLDSPSKLFFFCEIAPTSGGETPLVLSHIVYERMKLKFSELVEKVEKHGFIYSKFLEKDDDHSLAGGRSWKSAFATEDKSVAEERAAKQGIRLEWNKDGGVKRITGPIPAIRYDKSRQQKTWFTNTIRWEEVRNGPLKEISFGDCTPLPTDFCFECLRILEEECVAIPWQEGDVLLIDNLAVLHARRPTNSPRRILTSLCK